MSDVMLLGVLRMPPDLWRDTMLDVDQRYARYKQAANTIEELRAEADRLTRVNATTSEILERTQSELANLRSKRGIKASDLFEVAKGAEEAMEEARETINRLERANVELEALRKDAKQDWANHACEHLPEGWSIEVELEKNSGVMLLRDPDGCGVEICTDDITLEQQIFDAVDAAIAAEVLRADA